MIKKSLQTLTLTTLACSLLSGCVSFENAEGLPTWLEHGSQANQIAYFMGLMLERSLLFLTLAPPSKSLQLAAYCFIGSIKKRRTEGRRHRPYFYNSITNEAGWPNHLFGRSA